MKKTTFLAGVTLALMILCSSTGQAQEESVPSQVEVGIQFSSITFPGRTPDGFSPTVIRGNTEAGFGARVTFNLNTHVALEAEENYFPHENFNDESRSGNLWQAHFGVKVGKRFGRFGIFGKARPGLASFSKTITVVDTHTFLDFNGQPYTSPVFGEKRQTHFAMDLGGVLEFYPSRRVLTRIDVGDTMIHNGSESVVFSSSGLSFQQIKRTTHNLQVSAGIGFRFGSLAPAEPSPQAHDEKLQRFEVGAQFSSLGLHQIDHDTFGIIFQIPDFRDVLTQAGFGGRFTINLTPNFALEAQGDFYPSESVSFINNGRAGGRILQMQAGIKAGKRFEKFGIFAKARPGVVSFSKAFDVEGANRFGFPIFRFARKNYFSPDVGGVLEFYPTRRIVARFDGGDTMIFYPSFEIPIPFALPGTFVAPAETIHNFQFSAGVGFRF